MPRTKRTPPTSPALSQLPLTHCKSDSNLVGAPNTTLTTIAVPNLLRDATSDPNIAVRKRKRDDISREEVLEMLSTIKKDQGEKFTALMNKVQVGIDAHTEQNKSIQSSIEFLGQKYDEMVQRIDTLEREKTADKKYIHSLEARLDQMDRNLRSSSIEVRNIPKRIGETKDELVNLVKKVGGALSAQLQTAEIRDVYRINTKNESNQPIVAELSSVIMRDKIIGNVKRYNRANATNKFNTTNLKLQGPPIPIFISESLPPQTKKLFYMAREYAKENSFKFCWASRGRIYLRRSDGAALVKVNNEGDLDKLKAK